MLLCFSFHLLHIFIIFCCTHTHTHTHTHAYTHTHTHKTLHSHDQTQAHSHTTDGASASVLATPVTTETELEFSPKDPTTADIATQPSSTNDDVISTRDDVTLKSTNEVTEEGLETILKPPVGFDSQRQEAGREMERETEREMERETERETEGETERKTEKDTEREVEREEERGTDGSESERGTKSLSKPERTLIELETDVRVSTSEGMSADLEPAAQPQHSGCDEEEPSVLGRVSDGRQGKQLPRGDGGSDGGVIERESEGTQLTRDDGGGVLEGECEATIVAEKEREMVREAVTECEVNLHSSNDEVVRSKPGLESRQLGLESGHGPAVVDSCVTVENSIQRENMSEMERESAQTFMTATTHISSPEYTLVTPQEAVQTSQTRLVITENAPTETVAMETPVELTVEAPPEIAMATTHLTTVSERQEYEETGEELVPFTEADLSLLYPNRQLETRDVLEDAFIRESKQHHHPLYELLSLYLKARLSLATALAHLQVTT